LFTLAACGKLDDTVTTAQERIVAALRSQGIYDRINLPDPPPSPTELKGYFDNIGGAYRYIVNENRENRGPASEFEIKRGDSIAFIFDARIYMSGNFEDQQTFYTNDAARIALLTGNNPQFDGRFWPTDPLRIKIGDDPRILKSWQEALIGGAKAEACRAGDGDPSNDDEQGGIASDRVRIYLTSDIAFGNKIVYSVPARSTIVFEVTDIEIIR
jgi:hypothetical protein